ncbi:metallophosphoesterase [Hyalangium sp.]|uniref:metallophosphoesterase family protein n=1 Tax=Hyalangium sp. TaxID=2028555 RepID=UPI002D69CE7D|nr:metallophosphoesterase [Hyalangium sp.]HYI02016.1 metallophosphoesterase [Hyalangium sp.]
MNAAAFVDELVTRLQLSQGSQTLLLLVTQETQESVPEEHGLGRASEVLTSLLRHASLNVHALQAAQDAGPSSWVKAMKGTSADAWLTVLTPGRKLLAREVARRLNAQRQQLQDLSAPLILLVSAQTETLIQTDAPDFHTWRAATYVVPSLRELETLALQRNVVQVRPVEARRPVSTRPPIRFLHLSDLHLRHGDARRYDQNRVLRGLLDYLGSASSGPPIDLIFATGDLAFSGHADEFALVTEFLRELLEVTGVPPEHLFVVPGNHDVDRSAGRWLLRTLESDDEATAFFVSEGNRRWHAEKLAAYRQAMSDLLGAKRSLGLRCGAEAVEIVNIRDSTIAIASFNSSWFAQDDEDQSKLWLGEANVDQAGERIRDAGVALALALMHHPLDHLAEAERSHVGDHLERTFDLILRGHLHTPKSQALRSQRGGYLELAAPAAYQGSKWPNGCIVGAVDLEARRVELTPLRFGSGADPWMLDTTIFPDDAHRGYRHTFELRERRTGSQVATSLAAELERMYTQLGRQERTQVQRELGVISKSPGLADETTLRLLKHSEWLKDFWQALSRYSRGSSSGDALTRLAQRMSEHVTAPPKPMALSKTGALKQLLFEFAEFWRAQGSAWCEDFSGVAARKLVVGAFFCRAFQGQVRLDAPSPTGGYDYADILLGGDERESSRRAVIGVTAEHLSRGSLEGIFTAGDALRAGFQAEHVAMILLPGSGLEKGEGPGLTAHFEREGRNVHVLHI